MSFENAIHDQLLKHPKLKKIMKRIYQRIMYTFSKKIKSEGNIIKVSPNDSNYDYFFGYYDKSPWDITNRYMLCMKATDTSKNVSPNEPLEILLIDTQNDNKSEIIAKSNSWNVQQGCMAQWLGPSFDKKIIYNDFRDNHYCSVIFDVFTKEETIIDMPVYSVSSDGKFALTLDFSRLHRLRPGYGYSNILDATANEKIPDSPCIWKIDLEKNETVPYLYYKDFYEFETRKEMNNAEHKVNHIMISPDNDKFMVIHRWYVGAKKYSRLITCELSTKKMYNLSDDDMVSHCYWKNNDEIIAFENKKESGSGYYLMKDKTKEYFHLWEHIKSDGHPSYSPDGKLIITDTYPNRDRIQILKLSNEITNVVIGKVFSPFKYDNDTRCDLHPRWSRDGKKICFDGCFEGNRGLYIIPVEKIKMPSSQELGRQIKERADNRKRIIYLMTSCRKSGPAQQTLNIIKNLDTKRFVPFLVTIYDEPMDTIIEDYYPYIENHYFIKTSKKSILLNRTNYLRKKIEEINPDIIHGSSVFPSYAVIKMQKFKFILTLRNYIYDDFITKFGKIKGMVLAKMQLYSMKHATKTVTCSKSLAEIYREKLNLEFDYIQNGVDIDNYKLIDENEKIKLKKELNLNMYDKIFIYTGQFIARKNLVFLLQNFCEQFKDKKNTGLILLGDGPLLESLKKQYSNVDNIMFLGNSNKVNIYLSASDFYVSTSLSEGLPNGALEALSSGIPVVLSDINQHKELFMYNKEIGYIFKSNDSQDFVRNIKRLMSDDYENFSKNARDNIVDNFSSAIMSKKYQKIYMLLI